MCFLSKPDLHKEMFKKMLIWKHKMILSCVWISQVDTDIGFKVTNIYKYTAFNYALLLLILW